MKRLLVSLAALLPVAGSLLGTDALYLNTGLVMDEFPIDATVFDNRGYMNLTPTVGPYDTQATDYYYNSGLILSEPGIRFGFYGADGTRRPSLVFSNGVSGRIEAVDGLQGARNAYNNYVNFVPLGQQTADQVDASLNRIFSPYRTAPDSYLNIYADTIINRGALFGSSGGQVAIVGKKVDLSRSLVGVNPPADQTADDPGIDGGFDPIPGTQELHWGYGYTGLMFSRMLAFTTNRFTNGPGVVVSVTNVASQNRYRVGTESIAIAADGTLGTPFSLTWGGTTNVLNRDVVPFIWNMATPNATTASATNPATNQTFTIVMVRRATTNLMVDATISPMLGAPYPHPVVNLRLTGVSTNNITGKDDAVSIIINNSFGPDPQWIYLTNRLTGIGSHPTNLAVSRVTTRNVPNPFTAANTANSNAFTAAVTNFFAALRPTLPGIVPTNQTVLRRDILTAWTGPGLTNPIPYTNLMATNPYMAYRLNLTFGSGKVPVSPTIPNISPTNNVGRLVIDADELNLEKTRIRGQGPVILRTRNLTSAKLASIDAPYVDADLASKSGNLELNGVFQPKVQRLSGNITVFSATYTNSTTVDIPAPPPANPGDPAGTPTTVQLDATYHIMIVDADLSPSFPTPFIDLALHSTNVVIGDALSVTRVSNLDTENLTVTGRLEIRGDEGSALANTQLSSATAPKLQTLTNSGVIIVSNAISLGTDPGKWLKSIDNNGVLRSAVIDLKAASISVGTNSVIRAESGTLSLQGTNITLRAAATITDAAISIPTNSEVPVINLPGNIKSSSQLTVAAENLVLGSGTVLSAPAVDLIATRRFEVETNGAAINSAYHIGLNGLPGSIETRNLILSLQVPAYQEGEIVWPVKDQGASTGGFDGASVAQLSLDGAPYASVRFKGGALYVKTLNLTTNVVSTNATGLTLLTELITDPGVTVYYSAVNLGTNALSTSAFEAAALKTGGQFKQVQLRSGGQWVSLDGLANPVHASLRFSSTIDSDGDGIVNAFDPSPFDRMVLDNVAVIDNGTKGFRVTWDAAPMQTYSVQYTTDLGTWKTLQRVSNPLPVNQTLWINDPIPDNASMRAYRVMLEQ